MEKYLGEAEKNGDYLALVGKKHLKLSELVLGNDLYRRPSDGRNHYLWQDVYRLIAEAGKRERGLETLRLNFLEYMKFLGLAPSRLEGKWPQLFGNREDPSDKEVMDEFGRRLNGVKSWLSNKGFSVEQVSHCGLSAFPAKKSAIDRLIVNPVAPGETS